MTVVLLGMLFFTHSQLSIAAPSTILVAIRATDASGTALSDGTLDIGDKITFRVDSTYFGPPDAAVSKKIYYSITPSGGSATQDVVTIGNGEPATGFITIEGSTPKGVFAFVAFEIVLSGTDKTNYTTSTTPQAGVAIVPEDGITIDNIADITDVTSVSVDIASSGDDTDVTIGETVNVDVLVVNAAQGVADVANNAMKGDATAHTLQYKIGASGASTDLNLFRGDNDTHFTGMLPAVTSSSTAGAFTFESVKLSLQNKAGNAVAEVKTYTVADTSILTLTDAGLTIDPKYAVTDATSVAVGITSSGDDTVVSIGETVTVDINVGNNAQGVAVVDPTAVKGDTTAHKLLYDIGGSGTATEVALLLGDNNTHFTVTLSAVTSSSTAGAFTFESVKLSLQNAAGDATTEVKTYTTADTSILTLTDPGLTIDPSNAVADITSVAVSITGSGDGTDVLIGESVNVEVIVVNAPEGVAVVANNAMKGDATDHKLQYKIDGSGTSTDLALFRGDNDTHFTGMLPVTSSSTAGAFTFESVKLSLQNGAGTAITPKEVTYTTADTSILTLTDAELTLILKYAVTDVTSIVVSITGSGDGTDVTVGETVNVEVIVVNSAQGVAVVATSTTGAATAHTLQYKIGANGASTDLALFRGDNDTHFTGMLTVGLGTIAGAFTFESVTLSLQNGAGDAPSTKVKTYTTETTSDVVVTLTDAGLTTDPTSDITVLADAIAINNKAGVGDKVTLTAWITNTTNGIPLNVTVNYKITGAKNTTGSVLLTNQGLNGTSTTTDLWTGILTITDNTTAGNLTIVSIFVWLKNMDSSQTVNLTLTAADAMATNVVEVDIPAPVATTTSAADKTSSSASTSDTSSSSETTSDSPVSIFAVFILIASVSMAVGVYTLRRRQ